MSEANGNGRKMTAIVDNVFTIAAARLMSVIGVPLAGFLFWQMWGDIKTALATIETNKQDVAVLEVRVDDHSRRITDLEHRR